MLRQRFLNCVLALVIAGGLGSQQAAASSVPSLSASPRAAMPPAAAQSAGRPAGLRASPSGPTGVRREVFGFALSSSLSDPTVGYPSWNFSALSTVAFFGLHVSTAGGIVADSDWSVWNSSALTNLVATAHAAGTKVVVTIVLQDFSSGNATMCAGLAHRGTTVNQTVAQVVAKHVDGVNIDYEGLNGTCPNGQTGRAMLTDLAHQLRAGLPSGSSLSVDTYASSAADSLGFFDIAALNSYVSSFFVMAYDLEYSNYARTPPGCSSFCLGPTAPLAGYYYNDRTATIQYLGLVPPSKVILGVPYYGRKACVGGVAPNAYPIGAVTADSYLSASGESGAPSVSAYTAHRDAHDPAGQERWDTWFNSSLGCTRELYWDDVTSLSAKYDLIDAYNLAGAGIWNLNYGGGAPELWAALRSHLGGCTSVSASTSPAATAPAGTNVTVSAAASNCANANPLYELWMQPPGSSSWQVLKAYSAASSFVWSTAGKAPGTYHFSLWVHDAASPGVFGNALGRWDSYAGFSYAVTPTPCAAVTAAFQPASSALVGSAVTVSAAASGCPNPRYEFWILAPGASTWRLAQAYAAASTFRWTGGSAGTYRWSVWARDATSAGTQRDALGSWDSAAAAQYTLTPPCSRVSAAAAPASPQRVGTAVSVTASASACASPVYEFWMLAPGSAAWRVVQAYSSAAAYSWTTSALAAGTYQFSVWARDSGSAGTAGDALGRWDAYRTLSYTLSSPCASAAVTFSPAATARRGTTVSVAASASGCPHPLFEFWVLAPGSSAWRLAQGYGTAATLSWSTTGQPAGTYQFSVWARDGSSSGTAGDSFGRWDAYTSASYRLS